MALTEQITGPLGPDPVNTACCALSLRPGSVEQGSQRKLLIALQVRDAGYQQTRSAALLCHSELITYFRAYLCPAFILGKSKLKS